MSQKPGRKRGVRFVSDPPPLAHDQSSRLGGIPEVAWGEAGGWEDGSELHLPESVSIGTTAPHKPGQQLAKQSQIGKKATAEPAQKNGAVASNGSGKSKRGAAARSQAASLTPSVAPTPTRVQTPRKASQGIAFDSATEDEDDRSEAGDNDDSGLPLVRTTNRPKAKNGRARPAKDHDDGDKETYAPPEQKEEAHGESSRETADLLGVFTEPMKVLKDGKEVEGRYCNICRAAGAPQNFFRSKSSTTLRNHIKAAMWRKTHIPVYVESCKKNGIFLHYHFDGTVANASAKPPTKKDTAPEKWSKEGLRKHLVQLIVAANLPISFPDNPYLRKLLRFQRPSMLDSEIPHRTTTTSELMTYAGQAQASLGGMLRNIPGLGSATFDTWTSLSQTPYLAVTFHWIDSYDGDPFRWKLNTQLIGFEELPGSHTGANMAKAVIGVFDSYGIRDKFLAATADNVTVNDIAFVCMQPYLEYTGDREWDPKENRGRCCGHAVELAAKWFSITVLPSPKSAKKRKQKQPTSALPPSKQARRSNTEDTSTHNEEREPDLEPDNDNDIMGGECLCNDDVCDGTCARVEDEIEHANNVLASTEARVTSGDDDGVHAHPFGLGGDDGVLDIIVDVPTVGEKFSAKDILGKVLALINQVRKSPQAQAYFHKCCDMAKLRRLVLISYSRTRWGGMHDLLARLILLKAAVNLFTRTGDKSLPKLTGRKYEDFEISPGEWEFLELCRDALEDVRRVRDVFSSQTDNSMWRTLPVLDFLIDEWTQKLHDERFAPVAHGLKKGIQNLQKWFKSIKGAPMYFICQVLHPALKDSLYDYDDPALTIGKAALRRMFNMYRNQLANEASQTAESDPSSPAKPEGEDSYSAYINAKVKARRQRERRRAAPLDELDQYLEDDLEPSDKMDVVAWWGRRSGSGPGHYPVLARMARDYLAIQGSAVPSERAFSTASLTDEKHRTSMAPETFKAVQILKSCQAREGANSV